MSNRHVRKLVVEPTPDEEDLEDFEPHQASTSAENAFQGLISNSDEDSPATRDASSHQSSEERSGQYENTAPTQNRKKKKTKKSKPRGTAKEIDHIISFKDKEGMDEIDMCVMEVNQLLGEPAPVIVPAPKPPTAQSLFSVKKKHIYFDNELTRIFGEDPDEIKSRARQRNSTRLVRPYIVQLNSNVKFRDTAGLSMSIQRREGDVIYFTFDHSYVYQNLHKYFLHSTNHLYGQSFMPRLLVESKKRMYVESLIANIDALFLSDEHSTASELLTYIIGYFQHIAHYSFSFTNINCRLEYKYPENRPFHIVLLKYLYLQSNKICHRTALELCKLLLNLDHSDPLAILFIIDTMALRAREHKWLIEAVDFWARERDASFLFNIQYSYAMAHFHVATKERKPLDDADMLLQDAILMFPTVVMKILKCASKPPGALLSSHPLFDTNEESVGGMYLSKLIELYAKFTQSRWREPDVLKWLVRNAEEVADSYTKDKKVMERAKESLKTREDLFRGWPVQIARHLCVIKSMSNILVDGAIPRLNRTLAHDPLPPSEFVDRYGYSIPRNRRGTNISSSTSATLSDFFSSILPNFNVQEGAENNAADLERALDQARQIAFGQFAEIQPFVEMEVHEYNVNRGDVVQAEHLDEEDERAVDALAGIVEQLNVNDEAAGGPAENILDNPAENHPEDTRSEENGAEENMAEENQTGENRAEENQTENRPEDNRLE